MAKIDMRYVKAAKYTNTSGAESYSQGMDIGDAIEANINLEYDTAALYSNGVKSEGDNAVIGGTVTFGVDEIEDAGRALLFGHTYTAATTGETPTPQSLEAKFGDTSGEVGFGFCAVEVKHKVKRFYAIFFPRVQFTSSGDAFKTRGKTTEFQTPKASGELLEPVTQLCYKKTKHDSVAAALTWLNTQLNITA